MNDEYSKNLYLSAICNYVSQKQGFLICLYYSHTWRYYQNIILARCDDIKKNPYDYCLYDLSKINLAPIKLYYSLHGIFCDFYLEQYSYKNLIKAQKGDYVIDGGACCGDTALYFANLVGESGKVFAFEFIEDNIKLFNKNLKMNSHINNIVLVKHPLYADSDTFVDSIGSGSSATINFNSSNSKIKTLSIDDFVKNNNISKIDFIKLDIEGSEFDTLLGAKESIKQFKPKIAICLYHSTIDYTRIPLLLNEIMPSYKFYFDHFTLGRYESVLFAIHKD
ncbi:FkbM family methyltransferase [Helicobacter sp. MIT 99-5507]|uniref:FkbM family methyltransferase n=1 Tax=Helicobacter sp. MIT 99-5507 TaxID=152489 RepID=UPI0015F1404E|nr:FkbM family methyltransferase [Helicobacter sp. MIT 99-5507]